MRIGLILGIFILVWIPKDYCGKVTKAKEKKEPVEITSENFDETTEDGKGEHDWFIMFHMPWCQYCSQVAPVFDELSKALWRKKVRLGKINCEEQNLLATRFEVKKYPTLIMISNGYVYSYEEESMEFITMRKFATGGFENSPVIKMPEAVNSVEAFFKDYGEMISLSVMGLFAMILMCVCCCEMCLESDEDDPSKEELLEETLEESLEQEQDIPESKSQPKPKSKPKSKKSKKSKLD